jgi:hypothetical protein
MASLICFAALTPRPRVNLVLYHGVLAPHARWRPRAVSYEGSTPPLVDTGAVGSGARGDVEWRREAPGTPRYWAWADLMRRTFERDVRACPRCGGRMRLIATIEDPRVIRRILAQLRLPPEGPDPSPSRRHRRPRRRHPCLRAPRGPSAWPGSVEERPHPRSSHVGRRRRDHPTRPHAPLGPQRFSLTGCLFAL